MTGSAPDWEAVVEALRAQARITLGTHVNPDGDALGSLLGLALGLKKLGKEIDAALPEKDATVPPAYAFLPGAELLRSPEDVPISEVFVALDCGGADRLGELEEHARAAPCVVNIDHHTGNENFGHLNIVMVDASSTSELVARLLMDLGVDFDGDIATCLYTGVVTDTGRFQYENSSPETLRLAADLLSYGVPAPAIAVEVFDSAPFGYLKLLGKVLERATLDGRHRFVYSWITQSDLDDSGIGMNETEKLIDAVRATRDADVAAMFKEQTDGAYRASLRSKGPVSVGRIARAKGGGGHELAAGFTAESIEEAVSHIVDFLEA